MKNKNKEEKEITFVIGYMGNGGAERVVSILANYFINYNYRVNILAILGNKVDYQLDKNLNYIYYDAKESNKLLRIFERLKFIRYHTKNSDYIISFLAEINIYTIVSNIFRDIKLIISERNDPYQDPTSNYIRIIRDVLYQFADGYVFQTYDAKDYFSNRIRNKGVVIPNPLDSSLLKPYTGIRTKEIVTAARLEPQKNIYMLIDSFYKVNKLYPEYNLKIYGDGPQRQELIDYVNELGINNNVDFCGYSQNLHENILKSSIFVMTSNYEGISNSLIEALGLGIPVISTDHPIGGARMFIENGINGFLVPVNDVDSMSNCIINLIEDKQLSEKFSQNAIEIRGKLNVEKIIKQWESYILEID